MWDHLGRWVVNSICLFILLSVFTDSKMMPFLRSTQPGVHSYTTCSAMAELSSFLKLIKTFLNSGLPIHRFVLSHQKTHATGHWFKGILIYICSTPFERHEPWKLPLTHTHFTFKESFFFFFNIAIQESLHNVKLGHKDTQMCKLFQIVLHCP